MNAIPTDEAMQHLRAEDDDRGHVELLLAAAEDSAAQFMNRQFYATQDDLLAALEAGAPADSIVINPSIRAACLLILGSLYANREDVVVGTISSELPMGSRSLLTPYRVGWGV